MDKAYIANSLFSEADSLYNKYLSSQLRASFPTVDFYLPQENESINDKESFASSRMISRGDDEHLLNTSFMIAVIDGEVIDNGVSCEIGKYAGFDTAYQLLTGEPRRPIFALFTDVRQNGRNNQDKINALIEDACENQFPYRNLYVVGTIKDSGGSIARSIDELIENINRFYNGKNK